MMTGPDPKERSTFVGKVLTEKRLELGISQQRIAHMAGIAPRVYQRLETGEVEFCDTRMKYGLSLCYILGLDPWLLVFGPEFTFGGVFQIVDQSQNPDFKPESDPE